MRPMDARTEMAQMKKRKVDKVAVQRAAARSTWDSALLEGRVLPHEFVRSEKTECYLAERRQ